jgi:hypothetical protein
MRSCILCNRQAKKPKETQRKAQIIKRKYSKKGRVRHNNSRTYLVSIDRFEIHRVSDYVVLIGNTVAAKHVPIE